MRLDVLLFASYADLFGAPVVTVELDSPTPTVAVLVDELRRKGGGDRMPVRPLVALNRRYASPETLIGPGDEVALIPPVAGG